jgi:SAM-dependent methyltransferase
MSFIVLDKYVNPITKAPLIKDINGRLCDRGNPENILYEDINGSYDFVSKNSTLEEREYFDDFYGKNSPKPVSIETCQKAWESEPGFKQLLASLGDISGKKILLLGNGSSLKELYFLHLGARCVYTDLSIKAVSYVKKAFSLSELRQYVGNIEFHAADACQLPFPDNSFDIIYGCAFVHHLADLDAFFLEIYRCLKKGGICRFLDHAYSPLWQWLKGTVLKPVQIYTHKKFGISPADVISTKRGGYTRDELERIRKTCGFTKMLYLRVAFFEQLLQRGTLKLGGRFLRKLKPLMRVLDSLLDKSVCFVQKQGIVLVWGFTK